MSPAAQMGRALRQLRTAAGTPKYRVMARKAGYSAPTLSQAAIGRVLPTHDVVDAYVRSLPSQPDTEWASKVRAALQLHNMLMTVPSPTNPGAVPADHPALTYPIIVPPADYPTCQPVSKELGRPTARAAIETAPGGAAEADTADAAPVPSATKPARRRRGRGDDHRDTRGPSTARRVLAVTGLAVLGAAAVALPATSEVANRMLRGKPTTISGTATCAASGPVTGVWIHGQRGGDGWANWKADELGGPVAAFTYRLPYGGPWTVHVGCGGTPQNWRTDNTGETFVDHAYQDWHCPEPTKQQPSYVGCRPTAA